MNGESSYRRFLDGDDDGFVEIIRDYKDGLMFYLNGYVQNIHIAEELMEETFVRLVVKRPRFSGKSSFKTWLYAIGRNVAVGYLRKCSRLPSVSADELSACIKDEADLEKEYLRSERKILLHKALSQLKSEYHTVLYLVYFEDFSLPQAASVMKKSYKQVENLVYRAKQALKSELEKEGFVYEEL